MSMGVHLKPVLLLSLRVRMRPWLDQLAGMVPVTWLLSRLKNCSRIHTHMQAVRQHAGFNTSKPTSAATEYAHIEMCT